MSFKNNFRHISTTLFVFCLPIILFIAILFISHFKTHELQWNASASKSAFYFALVSSLTLPGFLLHYNHYQHDKGKALRFDTEFFEISCQSKHLKIYYKDILKVESHSLAWSRRNPWNNYGYIEIILSTREKITFTSLLVCSNEIETLFENNHISVEKVEELYTWVSK